LIRIGPSQIDAHVVFANCQLSSLLAYCQLPIAD